MRGVRFAVLFGLILATQVGSGGSALGAPNELAFSARVGETIAYTATAPGVITGMLTVPPDAARLLDDRSRIEVDCQREGVITITLEVRAGSVVSTVVLRIDCRGRPFEHAPAPGGTADEPTRFSTGDGTGVTQVDCKDPLSCNIANQGRQGGFVARCTGRGTGEGKYVYQYLETLPNGETRIRTEIRTRGMLTARCPRD